MDESGNRVRPSGTLQQSGEGSWVPDGTGRSQRRHSMQRQQTRQKDDTEQV